MEPKGDGTDLCCTVNPIRRCLGCRLTLCNNHWWNVERELLNLPALESVESMGVCPRCELAKNLPTPDWRRVWEVIEDL